MQGDFPPGIGFSAFFARFVLRKMKIHKKVWIWGRIFLLLPLEKIGNTRYNIKDIILSFFGFLFSGGPLPEQPH
ncbi:MAG: hypothetical protein MJ070_11420 [Lachnospiraceae bacterium]|nr:hypothetical protein [Lachnospiraceae bacterium]